MEHKQDNPEISLQQYFESKLEALALATKVANETMEKRLEGMNEFRNQLKDQAGQFFTKSEHELYKDKVDSDIRVLREYKAELQGKANNTTVVISIIIAVIGLLLGLGNIIVHLIK